MSSLHIEQLLRAAQIIEQNTALQQLMRHHHQQQEQQQQLESAFFKFGEDYQNRLVMPKMRAAHADTGGSTGSSRRSTPSGGMFSNCTPTPNGSSGAAELLILPQIQIASQQDSSAFQPVQSTVIGDMELLRRLEISAAAATVNNKPVTTGSTTTFLPGLVEQQQQQLEQQQQQEQQHQQQLQASAAARNSPSSSASSIVSMSIRQNRAAHNELEKNRRANLRGYLDHLKAVLPADADSTRDTTLSLLTRARNQLRALKKEKEALAEKRNASLAEMLRLRQDLNNNKTTPVMAVEQQQQQLQSESATKQPESRAEEQQQQPQQQRQVATVFASTSSAPAVDCPAWVPSGPAAPFVLPALPASALGPWWTQQQQQSLCQQQQQQQQRQQEEERATVVVKKALDLYMEGLLPALPRLYPYDALLRRHAADALAAPRC